MKFIEPKIHGFIDYVVVLILLISPIAFGFTGFLAVFTYALGLVHLTLTLLTNFELGVVKFIPLYIHGVIEFAVGVVLIAMAYTVFPDKNNPAGMLFYIIFGTAVLATWLVSNYRKEQTFATN